MVWRLHPHSSCHYIKSQFLLANPFRSTCWIAQIHQKSEVFSILGGLNQLKSLFSSVFQWLNQPKSQFSMAKSQFSMVKLQFSMAKCPFEARLFFNSTSASLAPWPSSSAPNNRRGRKLQRRVLRLMARNSMEVAGYRANKGVIGDVYLCGENMRELWANMTEKHIWVVVVGGERDQMNTWIRVFFYGSICVYIYKYQHHFLLY